MNEKARFQLWPLPDLRLSENAEATQLEDDAPGLAEVEFERGLEQGRAEGRQEAESMVASAMTALQSAYEELNAARRKVAADNERAVHTLAVAVARQIVQREIATDPALITELVRKAIEQVGDDGPMVVRVNPIDLTIVKQYESENMNPSGTIQWEPDASLERGSCVVEAPHRIVDGRIDSTLKELFHRLNDV